MTRAAALSESGSRSLSSLQDYGPPHPSQNSRRMGHPQHLFLENGYVKILGVIFDMDGLMLDTEPLYRIVWKRAAAACGYTITDEFYRRLVGRGRTVAERILSEAFGPGFPMEKFRQLSREDEVRAFTFDPVATKPGLEELLALVEARGWPKAVATSTERGLALPLLKRMGLLDRFVAVATGDEVTRGKPHPDLFLLAAERLGFAPGACLALEDSEAGVMAAASAAMPVYMVPDLVQPSEEVARAATGIFESLHDVKKELEQGLHAGKAEFHRRV